MSALQLHLALNHLPLFAYLLGILLLLSRKWQQPTMHYVSMAVIFAGIVLLLVHNSGEEIVRNWATAKYDQHHPWVDTHEELGEQLTTIGLIFSGVTLVGWIGIWRNKLPIKLFGWAQLITLAGILIFTLLVLQAGGAVSHPELR